MGKLTVLILWFWIQPISKHEVQVPNLKHRTFNAKVIRIMDGDTMKFCIEKHLLKLDWRISIARRKDDHSHSEIMRKLLYLAYVLGSR
ncbi:MAG: hypothetical protein ABWZ79_03525 [Pedobacter agri]